MLLFYRFAGCRLFHIFSFPGHRVGPPRLLGADAALGAGPTAGHHLVDGFAGGVLGVVFIFKADAGVLLERLNGLQHLGRALIAVIRVLFHRLFGDLAQTFRHIGRHLGQRLRLFRDLHDGDGHRAAAVKGQMAGKHLVHHNAHRVDVGTPVGVVALGLLGADIVDRTDRLVADGLALRAGEAGDAEVHHLDGTVRLQHNVLGLDIPVDDALGVGVFQRPQHLGGKVDDLFPGQGAAPLFQILFEGDAVDVFHHDILQLVGHRDIVHLDDVGMIQDRDGLRFIFETADQLLVVKEFFLEDLHRNGVAGAHVTAFVDIGHAAHAEQTFNQIAAVQLSANQVIHLCPPLLDRYFPRPTAVR